MKYVLGSLRCVSLYKEFDFIHPSTMKLRGKIRVCLFLRNRLTARRVQAVVGRFLLEVGSVQNDDVQ